jgi:heme exporter protein B
LSQLGAVLRKESLLQWRGKSAFVAVFAFGVSTLLLFSFGIGPDSRALRLYSAAFLWIALLLGSTLTLAESFRVETEQRAGEGMLLLPVDARIFFLGKALANWAELALLGITLVPIMMVLYDATPQRLIALVLIVIAGTAGLAAPGTLYAAMAASSRARQILLPLLLFPLVVPALLAAVKATSLVILGDPMQQLGPWVKLLLSFDLIYWSLCVLLFGKVLEE